MEEYAYSSSRDAINSIFPAISGFFFCIFLIWVVCAAFGVWLFYRTFQKAGYNGWMGLLSLIPSVGWLVCICVLAFDQWPALKSTTPDAAVGESVPTPVAPVYVPAAEPVSAVAPAPASETEAPASAESADE